MQALSALPRGISSAMKIDFDMLDKMVAAGASGAVVVAYLREQDARKAGKRAADKTRIAGKRTAKRATRRDNLPTPSDNARQVATLSDTPRARLFREGTEALIVLGRAERAARGLIAGWLKLTHDDDQLVLATILRARDLAVADAAGWILATLKGGMNGKSPRRTKSLADAADDLIARAEELGSQGPVVEAGDPH